MWHDLEILDWGSKTESVAGLVFIKSSTSIIVDFCSPVSYVDTFSVAVDFLFVC